MGEAIGRQIEGHRIEAGIGRGPLAAVYRATQLPQGRTVALKVLATADAGARERFAGAGAAAMEHPHPHLVPVLGAGAGADAAWIAMRYVDGPTLAELLRAPGGLEVRRALDLLGQAAGALDSLAARGAVHGAVSAENVLVGPGDHAYLTAGGAVAALRPGPVRAAGPEGDRRGLAHTAYAALTGAAPARGGPPASARNPALGPAVDAALARRAASATELVAALALAVAQTPGATASRASAAAPAPPPPPRRPRPVATPPPPPPPPPPRLAQQVPPPVSGPRWRVPAIVGGVLAALAIVIGVIAATTGGDGGPRTVTQYVAASPPATTAAPPATSTAPGLQATFPLGDVLPPVIDGWRLAATDPAIVNIELQDEGEVETARARGAAGVGLLAGVRPSGGDGRVVVERIRRELGGDPGGVVPLTGAASEGRAQSRGGVWAVTFGTPDRVVIALAGDRTVAAALAGAASAALAHP